MALETLEDFQGLILEALETTTIRGLAEKLSTSGTTIKAWASGSLAPSYLGRQAIAKELLKDQKDRKKRNAEGTSNL